jgi:hypothetical protein
MTTPRAMVMKSLSHFGHEREKEKNGRIDVPALSGGNPHKTANWYTFTIIKISKQSAYEEKENIMIIWERNCLAGVRGLRRVIVSVY